MGVLALPLILSVVGDLCGGITTDFLVRRFGLRIGRSSIGIAGNLIAGIAMIAAGCFQHPQIAVFLVATSVAATMFTLGATWGTCLDVGGAHVGVVSAAMNTFGQIGSVFGPPVVTTLLAHYGDWNAPLLAIGGTFLVGSLCWCFIDAEKRIF